MLKIINLIFSEPQFTITGIAIGAVAVFTLLSVIADRDKTISSLYDEIKKLKKK